MVRLRLGTRLGSLCGAALVGVPLAFAAAGCAKALAESDDDDTSADAAVKKEGGADSGKPRSVGGGSGGDDSGGDDLPADADGGSYDPGTISPGGGISFDGGVEASVIDDGPPVCGPTTQTSFVDLGSKAGTPFNTVFGDIPPKSANMSSIPTVNAPGWKYYKIDGAMCRDGSEFGVFARFSPTQSKKLFLYLEGGGACDEPNFCDHNPANVNQLFSDGAEKQGQTVAGSLTLIDGLQQPYTTGIFDQTNDKNPMKDWNGVYVPYCTGDVHFGTADNVQMPNSLGATTTQHFVGYKNMQKVMARVIATFTGLDQVILSGASAGGIGSALNFGLVQDSFGDSVHVDLIDDSGPPSKPSLLWPPCLQQLWRKQWGFGGSLPSDCKECNNADGTGLNKIIDYWHRKYPKARVGLISTMEDQVIRLFYGQGQKNCANLSANYSVILGAGGVSAADYTANLNAVVNEYKCTGVLATYLIGKSGNYSDDTLHQHIFRSEFFNALTSDGKMTLAQWTTDFVAGTLDNVGP